MLSFGSLFHTRSLERHSDSREHWVAVDPDKAKQPVRCFCSFTDSLNDMADWLESLGGRDRRAGFFYKKVF